MITGDGVRTAVVVVVSWNGAHLLPDCLRALAAQADVEAETWVVDNGSTDGTGTLLARDFPGVQVLRAPANLGFAGGNNLALRALLAADAAPAYAVLLNNDARPRPGWLAALLAGFDADPRVGAVASKVLLAQPPGVINSVGAVVDADGYGRDRGYGEPDTGRYDEPVEVFAAPGTAAAYRTAALAQAGVFDDDFFLYYEDTDLSWRLRLAGWAVRTAPDAVVVHEHRASTGADTPLFVFHDQRNRLLMLTKNATAGRAVREVARHPVTTASLLVQALTGLRVPAGSTRPPFSLVRARSRALASYLRLLPRMLTRRRAIGRSARVDRHEIERRWLG